VNRTKRVKLKQQQREIDRALGHSIKVTVDVTQECISAGAFAEDDGFGGELIIGWALSLAGIGIRGVYLNDNNAQAGTMASAPWGEIRGLDRLPDTVFNFLTDWGNGSLVKPFVFTITLAKGYVSEGVRTRARRLLDETLKGGEDRYDL